MDDKLSPLPVTEYEATMLRVLNGALTTMIQEAPREGDSIPFALHAVRDIAYNLSRGNVARARADLDELVEMHAARAERAARATR